MRNQLLAAVSESVCPKSNINIRRLKYNTQRHAHFQSPGEIKRLEVVLDPQVSPEEIKSWEVELGLKAGLLLPQSFLSNGTTDIVFVTLFHTAVETATAQ